MNKDIKIKIEKGESMITKEELKNKLYKLNSSQEKIEEILSLYDEDPEKAMTEYKIEIAFSKFNKHKNLYKRLSDL